VFALRSSDQPVRLGCMSMQPGEGVHKAALDHASAWFTVHAAQRMQLVNFWIVAVAFLTTALVSAATEKRWGAACLVALAGAVGSFCFHRLERRTRALVRISENALRPLQRDLANATDIAALEMVKAADSTTFFGSYGKVIFVLHWFVIAAFAFAFACFGRRWVF
jgi:hypothetical protein